MGNWAIDLLATTPAEESRSGLGRVVWELAAQMGARGHRVRVLYPTDTVEAPTPYRGVERVPFVPPEPRRGPYGYERAVASAASGRFDPSADLIVANDEKGGAILLPRSRRPGRPVFGMFAHDVQQHHLLTMRSVQQPNPKLRQRLGTWFDRRAIRQLERTAFSRAAAIVVASELNRQILLRYYPETDPGKVHVVEPGIAPLPDVGGREASREELHVPLDVPVVSFIGRTPDRQGLPIALEAFRRVRPLFPGARLLVAGCTAPAEPGVHPLGPVDEATKARVLVSSDVFLFPARYEGYGLAPREAMRAGVATVVSRHVPVDGAEGASVVRVVAQDDGSAYAAELADLFADPALRHRLAEAGRSYAERFSPERMAERFEAVFAPLLRG